MTYIKKFKILKSLINGYRTIKCIDDSVKYDKIQFRLESGDTLNVDAMKNGEIIFWSDTLAFEKYHENHFKLVRKDEQMPSNK